MSFYPGRDGNFTFNGRTNRCRKWDLDVEKGRHDVTYMEAGASKWRRFITGFNSGRISAEGPHDPTIADCASLEPTRSPRRARNSGIATLLVTTSRR